MIYENLNFDDDVTKKLNIFESLPDGGLPIFNIEYSDNDCVSIFAKHKVLIFYL